MYDPNQFKSRIHVRCSDRTPALIHKARRAAGFPSSAAYIRHIVCEAISRDLDIPFEALWAEQPYPRPKGAGLPRSEPIEEVR